MKHLFGISVVINYKYQALKYKEKICSGTFGHLNKILGRLSDYVTNLHMRNCKITELTMIA